MNLTDDVYTTIKVFRSDAAALQDAVDCMNRNGVNTDIPCTVQSLIDGWLRQLVSEEIRE